MLENFVTTNYFLNIRAILFSSNHDKLIMYISTGLAWHAWREFVELLQEFLGQLNLQSGQQVLDVGSGIGGSAFLMAQVWILTQIYVLDPEECYILCYYRQHHCTRSAGFHHVTYSETISSPYIWKGVSIFRYTLSYLRGRYIYIYETSIESSWWRHGSTNSSMFITTFVEKKYLIIFIIPPLFKYSLLYLRYFYCNIM